MAKVHLISLVGDTAGYREALHRWADAPPSSPGVGTRYTFEALVELLSESGSPPENPGPQVEATVVGTEETAGKIPLRFPDRKLAVRRIPRGANFAEQQEIVRVLRDLLHELRAQDVSTIYLDVTHGFRAQSLLAVSAASFVRAEWRRSQPEPTPERSAPTLRVLYGHLDDQEKTVDFWDLTDLLTLGDWTAALDAATRFGRADDLAALAKADETTPWRERDEAGCARHQFVQKLARLVQNFADDLSYTRWQALLVGADGAKPPGSAALLAGVLNPQDSGYAAFIARRPLLKEALEALGTTAQRLQARSLFGEDAVAASVRLATTYRRMNRFLECAATLREFGYTLLAHRLGVEHDPKNPVPLRDALGLALTFKASPSSETERDRNRVAAAIEAARAENRFPEDLVEHLRKVSALRNDLLHGGVNAGPVGREKVAVRLGEFLDAHRQFAESPGLDDCPP